MAHTSALLPPRAHALSALRRGDAFREAHGGTSIGAFVSTMVNSMRTLKGKPSPAFYDGLLHIGSGPLDLATRGASVDADVLLPAECFVACNTFFVREDARDQFEQRWASRESKLNECDGFVSFTMLRRDGKAKDEHNYMSCTIWRDRAAFDAWRKSQQFAQAHGGSSQPAQRPDKAMGGGPPMFERPPRPILYEGVLRISSAEGT